MPNDLARMRIGIVVSKRISKHAVTRNHIKRLLGEAIRASLPELSGGWDVIFSARSLILTADLPILQQDVRALLRRAQLPAPAQTPEARS
jgi:ribonuclease P protein component